MGGMSKGETAQLVSHLQAQGARIEGKSFRSTAGKPSSELRFPLKVFPPNGSAMFTIHQTVGDRHQRTVLDGIIRRAGLQPPGVSRKEKTTMTDPAPKERTEPLQHVKVPPAVLKRKHPPREEMVKRFLPYVTAMPETFWTDQLVDRLQVADVQGYRGTAGPQHAIEMLDWLGWRVVEAKPNRSGFSYRWVKDPNAVVLPGVTREERAARASRTLQAHRAAQRDGQVTPIREEPTLTDEEFDRQMEVIDRAGTVPQGNDGSWPTRPDTDGVVTYVPSTGLPVDTVAKADYEALEAMALETERKLAEAHAEAARARDEVIAQRDALNGRLSELERQRDALRAKLNAEQDTNERLTAHLSEDEIAALLLGAHVGPTADDSWLLTEDDLDGDMTLIELMASARRMRVAIEIRARKA